MKRHVSIEFYIKRVATRLLCFAVAMFWLGYFFGEKV